VELGTARVLAMCEQFDKAIETRKKAQSRLADQETPELREIDTRYAKRYREMIARHEKEFDHLFKYLNSVIRALKDKAEGERAEAQAELQSQDAFRTGIVIETVVEKEEDPRTRDRVIQALSPRSRRPSRR
jgi:hypothetical protein